MHNKFFMLKFHRTVPKNKCLANFIAPPLHPLWSVLIFFKCRHVFRNSHWLFRVQFCKIHIQKKNTFRNCIKQCLLHENRLKFYLELYKKVFLQLLLILGENLLFIFFSENFSRKSMEKCAKITALIRLKIPARIVLHI